MMRKICFGVLVVAACFIWGLIPNEAEAVCKVTSASGHASDPGSFPNLLTQVQSGGCLTQELKWWQPYQEELDGGSRAQVIFFEKSMEIFLKEPLSLKGESPEFLILVANPGTEVRISGKNIRSADPGFLIGRSRVILDRLTLRDFLGSAIHISGDRVSLYRLKLIKNGLESKSGVLVQGSHVKIVESEIRESGMHGIEIVDPSDGLPCMALSPSRPAQAISIINSDIHHNGGHGVKSAGYQVRIFSEGEGLMRIAHHPKAGVFIQANSKGYECTQKPESLHTTLISQVSFVGNEKGIDLEGPVLATPTGLVALPRGGGPEGAALWEVTGGLPLPEEVTSGSLTLGSPTPPWSKGRVRPEEIIIEIYAAPDLRNEGSQYLGKIVGVDKTGTFRGTLTADLNVTIHSLLAIAIDPVNGISSGFSMPFRFADNNDVDQDGLSNEEEAQLGTDPKNPDTDQDGLKDGEEVSLLLDPTRADSDGDCLSDGLELGRGADAYAITWQTQPLRLDLNCVAQAKESGMEKPENAIFLKEPGSWENIAYLYDLDEESHSDPKKSDSDGDDLEDEKEDLNLNGRQDQGETDATKADSDGDGLKDGEERARGTDATSPDTDGDGLKDGEEIERYLTDPKSCDSDSDSLGDGLEAGVIHPDANTELCLGLAAAGSNFSRLALLNPILADSDGDGIPDGEEDANHNGWLDPEESDPTSEDTDEDGIPDGVEAKPSINLNLLNHGSKCAPPPLAGDLDCDGIPNFRDADSDEDGCPDQMENLSGDQNRNGIRDTWEQKLASCNFSGKPAGPTPAMPQVGQEAPKEKALPIPKFRGGGSCQLIRVPVRAAN